MARGLVKLVTLSVLLQPGYGDVEAATEESCASLLTLETVCDREQANAPLDNRICSLYTSYSNRQAFQELELPARAADGSAERPYLALAGPTFSPFIDYSAGESGEVHEGPGHGYLYDVFRDLLPDTHIKFTWTNHTSFDENLLELRTGKWNFLMQVYTKMSTRLSDHDFSYTIYPGGTGLLTRKMKKKSLSYTVWTTLGSNEWINVGSWSVVLFVITCNLLWLVESRCNQDFKSSSYVGGFFISVWYALVTLATTGYGDVVPQTPLGKALGCFWILCSMFIYALVSGQITAALTTRQVEAGISHPRQTQGRRVGTVRGAATEKLIATWGCEIVTAPTSTEAFDLIVRGQVDAVAWDWPEIMHWLHTNRSHAAGLTLGWYSTTDAPYGIPFPKGSMIHNNLQEHLNRAILDMYQHNHAAHDLLRAKWGVSLPDELENDEEQDGEEARDSAVWNLAVVLCSIYLLLGLVPLVLRLLAPTTYDSAAEVAEDNNSVLANIRRQILPTRHRPREHRGAIAKTADIIHIQATLDSLERRLVQNKVIEPAENIKNLAWSMTMGRHNPANRFRKTVLKQAAHKASDNSAAHFGPDQFDTMADHSNQSTLP